MNLATRFLLICSISFILYSCKKEEPEYDYGPFTYGTFYSILSNGSTVIELKQSTSNSIIRKTKGGPQISCIGGMLTLNGGGKVTIGVKDPLSIQMNGGGLENTGPLSLKQLSISQQTATIILDSISIDSVLSVSLMNFGDCKISGKASYLSVSTTNYPKFFGFGLVTDSCIVNHMGLNDVQVNVTQKLKGASYGMGNTFYKGNPPIVNVAAIGSGKFIPY